MLITGTWVHHSPAPRPEPVASFERLVETAPRSPGPESRTRAGFADSGPLKVEDLDAHRARRDSPLSIDVRRFSFEDARTQRALAAYVSVQRLEQRDDLRALSGIDLYA